MRAVREFVLVGVAAGMVGVTACSDTVDPGPCVCTEEFRIFPLTVIDDAGNPVPDVIITRTNLRTGQVLEPGWLGLLQPGVYLIADDGMLDVFSSLGDQVRVTGRRGAASFVANFVFSVPAPCRCHVEKVAGPDTVMIQ